MTADLHTAWLWMGMVILGTVILGLSIFYGSAKWRRASRDPKLEQSREEITRQRYRQENRPG